MVAFLKQQHNLPRGFVVSVQSQSISESFERGESRSQVKPAVKAYFSLSVVKNRIVQNTFARPANACSMAVKRLCQRHASVPSVLCSEVVRWVAWEMSLRREGGKQLTRGSSAHISKVCAVVTAQI